ncbi:hypothetical protein LLH03_14820 [bacterium]|nr:hypothetical protein [bacterium]
MTRRAVFVAILALALTAPVFAGDIIAMPTGNTVAPKDIELNAIWWKQPPSGTSGDILVGEAFFGVMDRVELDVLYADVRDAESVTEVNAYVTLLKETPKTPSFIVGCTNVTGADWLGGTKFGGPSDNDDPSFFAVSSYNLAAPAVPSFKTPMIRLHLGWGNNWHGDELFGGVQFKVYPNFGGAILNYQSNPAYMLTWQPCKTMEVTGGTNGGETFFRVGGFLHW